ncbi:hypothetical protein [Mumia sp. Pv 4-285]|uniref:hypothetical protein n=1 Tax=Mumia qirimensis TaxID=3234852 RepID=UPI00351D8DC5
MDRVQEILPVKRAVEDELLSRPGVTGVDIGYKYVDGERTDEIVIRVYVAEKKDVSEDDQIPPTIEGIPTDVIEGEDKPLADAGSYNPLKGGISVGPYRVVDGFWAGTLGAIVIDNDTGAAMALSNYHVFCVNEGWHEPGRFRQIVQPSLIDNPFASRFIANISRGTLGHNVDAAVAQLGGFFTGYVGEVTDVGVLTGTAEAKKGMKVRKRGRTTTLTYGIVDGLHKTTTINYDHGVGPVTFTDQISVAGVDTTPTFAGPGDSGSTVVDELGRVIGLLFAGDSGRGTLNPIQSVLNTMNVRLALTGAAGFDLTSTSDRVFAYDGASTGNADHLVMYRPGKGALYIAKRDGVGPDKNARFTAPYHQPQGGSGIAGFDLISSNDHVIAFDGASTGKLDHLLAYRPGTGIAQILKHDGDQPDGTPIYSTVYSGTNGIAGFDLTSTSDRVIAYDLEGTGKLDHLVLYRPGKGAVYIVRRDSQGGGQPFTFTAVYQQPQGGSGIGGFDLTEPQDRIIAFDAEKTGNLDHLLLYRPGKGIAFVLRYDGDDGGSLKFTPIYSKNTGIGGFDLTETQDRVIAYDLDGSGHPDHLVLYRPGTSAAYKGAIFIVENDGWDADGNILFKTVYEQTVGGSGIGGYELTSPDDHIVAFDGASTGKLDHLLLYRAGTGRVRILKHSGSAPDGTPAFTTVYRADGLDGGA